MRFHLRNNSIMTAAYIVEMCYMEDNYRDTDWYDEKEPFYNKPIKKLKNQVHNKQSKNAPIPGRKY